MKKTQHWLCFSISIAFIILIVAPKISVALSKEKLQIKRLLEHDIKNLEKQKGKLVKSMYRYNKLRRKWKKDLGIWRSRHTTLVNNKNRFIREYGEGHYQEQLAKAFNYMMHCQDRYNNYNGIIFELGRQIAGVDHQLAIKRGQLVQLESESETSASTVGKKKEDKKEKEKAPVGLFGKTGKDL